MYHERKTNNEFIELLRVKQQSPNPDPHVYEGDIMQKKNRKKGVKRHN